MVDGDGEASEEVEATLDALIMLRMNQEYHSRPVDRRDGRPDMLRSDSSGTARSCTTVLFSS
jgi:hypothetical protein